MRKFSYLAWPIVTGILAATLILQLFPGLLGPNVTTVEIRQAGQSPQPAQPGTTGNGPVSYADAVDKAAGSVVNIYTRTVVRQQAHPFFNDPAFRKFFDFNGMPQRERIQSSLGSGVLINEQGYIATNNHVIAGADSVLVALRDGREANARIVGTDPETDLAVLKIDLPDLPGITLADSDTLRVGDVTLAIGNPFGVGQTVTMGIVSATGRTGIGLNTYEDFIQTDAAINPGNSGGALIDAHGNLVGINTAIFSKSGGSQGIGFAIPANLARRVLQDLVEHGRVVRGWMGVEIQQLTPRLAESFGLDKPEGLLVAGIFRNGPAHKAGLQPGDVILRIDGQPIDDGRSSMGQIAERAPGESLKVTVLRSGRTLEYTIKIGERPVQNKQ